LLDEMLQASNDLVLVEGESDCWTLWHHSIPALGIPGAKMTSKLAKAHVEGFSRLLIFREPDEGGTAFVNGLAGHLHRIGYTGMVRMIQPLHVADKDPNQIHKQHASNAAMFKLRWSELIAGSIEVDCASFARERAEVGGAGKSNSGGEAKKQKPSQAQILLQLASDAELFHTPDQESYATFPVGGHAETWSLRSKHPRLWLSRRFFEAEGKPPGSQALQDALGILEAKAHFEGQELEVHRRVAGTSDFVYVDLCNAAWEVVEVSPGGWRVISASDALVKFKRKRGMLPLPRPEPGGSLHLLRPFVNLADEASYCLLLAWLVAALRQTGPYPVLLLRGENGSAKSTACRALRALIDPSTAPLRTTPSDERDLMIAASNSWLLAFDNLSGLGCWLSDAICRLATGGGFSTRELYTDSEEVFFDAMRPICANSIEDLASRQDLLDRSILLTLPAITEKTRLDEAKFWCDFKAVQPQISGALFDAVAAGLRNVKTVQLEKLPRMADFARWVTACEQALPWPRGGFMKAYATNREEALEAALETDPVAVAIRSLLETQESWGGTATDLATELAVRAGEAARSKTWPRSARGMSNALRRSAPGLRQAGIDIEFYRSAGAKSKRLVRVRRKNCVASVASVAPSASSLLESGLVCDDTCDAKQFSDPVASHFASQDKPSVAAVCDASDACDAKIPTHSSEQREWIEL
jgi:hypothetical protein